MSKSNQLKFVSLGIDAFAGIGPKTKVSVVYPQNVDISEDLKNIDKDNGLMIVFPEGYNYVEIQGNQGVGKTSLVNCLREATGGDATATAEHESLDAKEMPVTDKRYKDRFWGKDGHLYNLRVTKSTITLERIEVDAEGNPILNAKQKENASIMKSPKGYLQQVIGPAGINPMALKEMNGADQVKWIRSLFTYDVEQVKLENEIKTNYDNAYKERTKVNSEYTRLENVLEANEYYKNMEKWQKYFDETKFEEIQAAVASVIERRMNYDKAVEGLPILKDNLLIVEREIAGIEEQIKKLQEQLEEKKQDAEKRRERITAGDTFIKENAGVVKEYEDLAEKRKEVTDFKLHEQSFKDMQKAKADFDKSGDEKIRLNGLVDKYATLKQEFIKQFTPNIPGLEVCIKDEGETREGIYYNKRNLIMLAESELWELATQIWKAMDVKIIYVENVNSLGSGAVAKFNEFLSSGGCYIFGTQMNRNEDSLKITFHDKIPE